jgi:hypothetical protein
MDKVWTGMHPLKTQAFLLLSIPVHTFLGICISRACVRARIACENGVDGMDGLDTHEIMEVFLSIPL